MSEILSSDKLVLSVAKSLKTVLRWGRYDRENKKLGGRILFLSSEEASISSLYVSVLTTVKIGELPALYSVRRFMLSKSKSDRSSKGVSPAIE